MNTERHGKSDLLISIVTTVRDAALYVEEFVREADSVLGARFKDYEIVIVDNGSHDDTVARVEGLQKSIKNVQLYCLATPIRREIDILVGIDQAIGDLVVTLDARYDPPHVIPQMVEAFETGAEIVYGLRRDRLTGHGAYQKAARLFFSLHRSMTKADLPIAASSFRLMSRRVVNSFIAMPNRFDLFPVVTTFTTFRYATIPYDRTARPGVSDTTEYFQALRRAMRILLLGSHYPLRLLTAASLAGATLSFLYSFYVVALYLMHDTIEGWAAISLQISGLFFLLFLILAAMNEYIFQIFLEQQKRDAYLIARESSSSVLVRKQQLNLVRADTVRIGGAEAQTLESSVRDHPHAAPEG